MVKDTLTICSFWFCQIFEESLLVKIFPVKIFYYIRVTYVHIAISCSLTEYFMNFKHPQVFSLKINNYVAMHMH